MIGTDWDPIAGLYACGEMVGGLFHHNYPGGSGLMSGAVFGRIAGCERSAAAHAASQWNLSHSLASGTRPLRVNPSTKTMKQIRLRAVFMRGGTSKAVMFRAEDLPRRRASCGRRFSSA